MVTRRMESDLYGPVKESLTALGYAVRGEVNGCDLVAVRGDEILVVELKVRFNLDLLLQGVERQRVTDAVYLAVEAPRTQRGARRWGQIKDLCRRLDLGLMTVHFGTRSPVVEVLLDPGAAPPRRSPQKRSQLLREFAQRHGDHNTGGVTRRPIVTAYREEALQVAACLRSGPTAVRAVRAATGIQRTGRILYDNHYGWFEQVGRGVYRLTPPGEEALRRYADVVAER